MHDYIISVDENGSPYISHAGLFGRRKGTSNKSHKYIEKIVDGTRTRYFYTKAELDAYYNSAKKKVGDSAKKIGKTIDDKVIGVGPKRRLEEAVDKEFRASDKYASAQKEFSKTYDEKIERPGPKRKIQQYLSKDAAKEDAEAVKEAYYKQESAKKEYDDARHERYEREREYDKTLLSKLEDISSGLKNAPDNIKEGVEDAVNSVGNLAVGTTEYVYDRVKSDLEKRKKERIDKETDKFIDAINKKTVPYVNGVNMEALRKSSKFAYDADTNEVLNVYDYLEKKSNKRQELFEEYKNSLNDRDRRKLEKEISEITEEIIEVLKDEY